MMFNLFIIILVAISWLPLCGQALLDEPIVSFNSSNSDFDIARSTILCSQDDEIGVHIAAGSLATDLRDVTGVDRPVLRLTNVDEAPESPSAIIVGSVNSSIIRHLHSEGLIDVSEIDGKWESFMTTVVLDPLPSVKKAFVVVGSDKRGTIFGIYTLSEQSGQSPYVSSLAQNNLIALSSPRMFRHRSSCNLVIDIIFGRTFPQKDMIKFLRSLKPLFNPNPVSSIAASSSTMRSLL